MKISFTASIGNFDRNTGYGAAGYQIVTSLQRLGHDVPFASKDAPVELAFCMPDFSEWSNPDAFHIQYTPWESSKLKPGWLEAFNENSDEVWTTSPLIRDWYAAEGVKQPIYVYEHGVDHSWSPERRRLNGPMRFLHIGEPAPRKGGQMAMEAFREVFGDSKDHHLTIKAWNRSWIRAKYPDGSIVPPHEIYKNVVTVYNTLELPEMQSLVKKHHVLVYPSWGEGFGLIPLEAMATGMPSIVTGAWAPYERFILPELNVASNLVDSPWDLMHPGQMFEPNFDDLKRAYTAAADDYDRLAGRAYKNSLIIHKDYDWDRQTEAAFAHIVEKFTDK